MSILDDLKKNLNDVAPGLGDKTSALVEKAKNLQQEVVEKATPLVEKTAPLIEKATPIVKDAGSKALSFAKEQQEKTRKAIAEANVQQQAAQQRYEVEQAQKAEQIRTMYEPRQTPDMPQFIEEAFHHEDQIIGFSAVSGVVLETNKRESMALDARLHTSSHAGISMVAGYGSASHSTHSNLSVSANSATEHEFWLLTDQGIEQPFQLSNHDIPLRAGQRITLIFSSRPNGRNRPVVIINHNAQRFWQLHSGASLNALYGLYTDKPGFFNRREVEAKRERLEKALDRRLNQLGHWGFRYGTPNKEG